MFIFYNRSCTFLCTDKQINIFSLIYQFILTPIFNSLILQCKYLVQDLFTNPFKIYLLD